MQIKCLSAGLHARFAKRVDKIVQLRLKKRCDVWDHNSLGQAILA